MCARNTNGWLVGSRVWDRRCGLWLLVLGLLGLAPRVGALPEDGAQPVEIAADRVELDQRAGEARYLGRVVVTQGSLRIEADQVRIRSDANGLKAVEADGDPARYRQLVATEAGGEDQELSGSAARILYQADERTIILEGNAQLRQGGHWFSAGRILFDVGARQLQATADPAQAGTDGRVRLVLPPPQARAP